MSEHPARGRHVLIDATAAPSAALDDEAALRELLASAAEKSCATVLEVVSRRFAPSGVTVVALLAESHASVHTYPESGAYFADVFTCGDLDPWPAANAITAKLGGAWRMRGVGRGT